MFELAFVYLDWSHEALKLIVRKTSGWGNSNRWPLGYKPKVWLVELPPKILAWLYLDAFMWLSRNDVCFELYRGKDWNQPMKSCKSETQPFFGLRYPAGTPLASVVLNKVLSRVKKPVYLLDITTLSQYRKDAHPIFYSGNHIGLDCSHWCLPGLPDTWNVLMNAALSY